MKKFNLVSFIPTFFYVGYLPKMPGTWGSLFAFVLFVIPETFIFESLTYLFFLFFIVSLPLISKMEKIYGNDPSIVVIDEVLGMWLIFLFDFIRDSSSFLVLGFILFRIIDIYKPLYIKKINDKSGSIYVILDDLIAAIYTIAIIFLLDLMLRSINISL